MSMSDDPRGFRRGQAGPRDYPQQQGHGGRAPAGGDRYPPSQGGQGGGRQDKPQPSFSAYRPEAYAGNDRGGPGREEQRQAWDDGGRKAPPPQRSSGLGPTSEPFPRIPQQRDPYYQGASHDPYAVPQQQPGMDNDWRQDPYPDPGPHQHPGYYPPLDDAANGGNVQEMHDHFFAPDREAENLPPPPPPQPLSSRLRNAYDGPEYGGGAGGRDYGEPAKRHHGVHAFDSGFDDPRGGFEDPRAGGFDNPRGGGGFDAPPRGGGFDDPRGGFEDPRAGGGGGGDFEWDKYEQAPAPAAARPFHPPATIPDDDLDADFFGDEDDYDADEYDLEQKGGRKKLMAAVLAGAVVAGGGLAYMYKSTALTGGGGAPSLIAADSRPVKEQPTEPGGREFANGNKLIYDRLGGEETASEPKESGGENSASLNTLPGIVTTRGTLEERIENALRAQKEEAPAANNQGGSPDAPRAVRTVTYGPDGNPQPAQTRTQRVAATDSVSAGVVVTTAPTAASPTEVSPGPSEAPVEARQPRAEPAPERVASVAPATLQVTENAGGTGQYFVQIAARNDQEAAVAAFTTLQQKYAGVIGNYAPSVRKVDLGTKGVWYRLLVGPVETKGDADQLCEQLKTAGMKGCFSRRD